MVPKQVSNLHYLTHTALQFGDQRAARQDLYCGLNIAQTLAAELPLFEMLSAAIHYLLYCEQPEQAAGLFGLLTTPPDAQAGSAYLFYDFFAQLSFQLDAVELTTAIELGKRTLDLASATTTMLQMLDTELVEQLTQHETTS